MLTAHCRAQQVCCSVCYMNREEAISRAIAEAQPADVASGYRNGCVQAYLDRK